MKIRQKMLILICAYFFAADGVFAESIFVPFKTESKHFGGDVGIPATGAKDFEVRKPRNWRKTTVNANEMGVDVKPQNFVKKLNEIIALCKKNGTAKLLLNKGKYYISENEPIVFDGIKDFQFDANGSVFVCLKTGEAKNMEIKNCEDSKFSNFSFDWDCEKKPIASLVKIVGKSFLDGQKAHIDFEFIEHENFPDKTAKMIKVSAFDFEKRESAGEGAEKIIFAKDENGDGEKKENPWLSPNKIRIKVDCEKSGFNAYTFSKIAIGTIFRMEHFADKTPALLIENCQHISLENVNIYASAGAGILMRGEKQKFCELINCDVKRPPYAPNRTITTSAFNMRVENTAGFFKMIDCDIGLGGEDGLIVGDTNAIARPSGKNSIVVQTPNFLKAGDAADVRHDNFFPTEFKRKVERVEKNQEGKTECFFSDELPPLYSTENYFVIFNLNFNTQNVIIKNCSFFGNGGDGLRALCKNITIDNCLFKSAAKSAISLSAHWQKDSEGEGTCVENVLIRNCTFEGASKNATADINAFVNRDNDPKRDFTRFIAVKDLLVEHNTFIDSFGLVALISSSGNVTIRENKIISITPRKVENENRASFLIRYTNDAHVINNLIIDNASVVEGVHYDDGSVSDLIVAGNRLINK